MLPFLMIFILPPCSTTKILSKSPGGEVTYRGLDNPDWTTAVVRGVWDKTDLACPKDEIIMNTEMIKQILGGVALILLFQITQITSYALTD